MHRATTDAAADAKSGPAGRLDWSSRLAGLVEALRGAGMLTDPAWEAALRAMPRHLFIPDRAWIQDGSGFVALDRDRDPERWWDAVYRHDTPIVTQFNDAADPGTGPPGGPGRAEPSSSCPAPQIQLQMLAALGVADGLRVLEIGTGTGWNAALLAARLGDDAVTTVEVDPTVVGQARRALLEAGAAPTVVYGDGRHGHAPGAPYDRIIATCAVTQVPYSWVAQTRVGGVILTPWVPPAAGGGPLARLTVNGDGTASGPFVGTVGFMRLRQQRTVTGPPPFSRFPGADPLVGTAVSTTALDPAALLLDDNDTAFPGQLALGDGQVGTLLEGPSDTDPPTVWLSAPVHASWARIRPRSDTSTNPDGDGQRAASPGDERFMVEQYGSRRLWDEIEAAYRWWERAGRPDRLRFGLTVTQDRQVVWLDDPTRPVVALPGPASPDFLAADDGRTDARG